MFVNKHLEMCVINEVIKGDAKSFPAQEEGHIQNLRHYIIFFFIMQISQEAAKHCYGSHMY